MDQSELRRYLAKVLEDMGLRYFITGSTATMYYGEPRLTIDIDVVVDLNESRVSELCRRFPENDFYVSESAALDAVRRKSQFNIIHSDSGLKVDVIIPEMNLFNRSRFARTRRLRDAAGFEVCLTSPEDAIIKKLEFYKEGGSEKHLRDIAGILKIGSEKLDTKYIAQWADDLGVREIWDAVAKRVQKS